MHIDQFTFKKSGMLTYEEEATVKTNKNDSVVLLKKGDRITVRKFINNRFHCESSFNVKENKDKFTLYLKNIGKK